MLGLVKLLTLIAASLLLFSGVRQLDWGQSANSHGIKADIELLLQGKENIFSLFERFPWFANAAARETEIEAAMAVTGVVCLMLARRFSVAEFLSKFVLTFIFLGVLFTLVGQGRQVIANLSGSFPVPQYGSLQSTNRMTAMAISAEDDLLMEPGLWSITARGTAYGSPQYDSGSRCVTPELVQEIMRSGQGLVNPPSGFECHLQYNLRVNQLIVSGQCSLGRVTQEILTEVLFDSKGHFSARLTQTYVGQGGPWKSMQFEGSRLGPC
jgi:hypothetical protein